jgi:hypothetical protein
VSDLVSRLLEAIETEERVARESGPARIGWATYRDENGQMLYTSPVAENGDVWVTAGSETEPNSVQVVYDPASVLLHCKADRATVIQYDLLRWRPDYTPGLGETLGVLRLIVERIALAYGITEEET